jgi:hypothetical protein
MDPVLHQEPCQGSLEEPVLVPVGVELDEAPHRPQQRLGHLRQQADHGCRLLLPQPIPTFITTALSLHHGPLSLHRGHQFSTGNEGSQPHRRGGLAADPSLRTLLQEGFSRGPAGMAGGAAGTGAPVKGGNGRHGLLPRSKAGGSDPAIHLGKSWGKALLGWGGQRHTGRDQQC